MSTEQLRFTLSLDTSGVDQGAAKASKSLRDVEKAASHVGTTTAKAGAEASTGLGKTATAAGTAEKSVTKAGAAASKAGKEAAKGGEEAAKGWAKFSEAAQSADWGKVTGGLAAVGVAMALPVGAAVKEFATFDQAMSGVASTGDDARASIDQLREAAMSAGADTAFSATEAANAVEELARAGVSAADTLGGGLAGSLDLAAAGTIEVADAAGIASTAMTQFKLSGKDIPHVADLLAAGAGKAMGGVDDLGMALKQSGLVASQFGLSIEETVGGLAAFASAGLLGSDAGTSLKTMLLALANPTGKSKQLLDELGISAYDAQGQFVGLEGLAGQLKAGMEGLTDAQRQQALATIFGTDAIRPASILYEQGAEGIRTWTEAVDDAGYAAETAATLQDNLVGDLEKLGGSWSTLAITMGEAADGPLRSAVQGLTGLLDAAAESPAAAQAIFGVTAGLAGLTLGAAALMKGVTFVAEFRDASAKLAATSPGYGKVASGLGKVAGAAAGLATAATAVVILGELAENLRAVKAGADVAEASVTRLIAGTGDLDAVFKRADGTGIWESMGFSIDSVASAMDHLVEVSGTPLEGWAKSAQSAREQFGLLDQELSKLTMGQSTDVFAGIAEKATAAGMGVEDLITLFPDYAAQVQQLAAVNGLGELSAADLAAAMAGTYEPLMAAQQAMGDTTTAAAAQEGAYDAAAASAEELAAAQKETADAARAAVDAFTAELDAIQSLNDAQTGAANTQLAAERAADSYRDKLDKISETLKENGNSFDETSEKGRANREALRDLASSARSTTDAMLANGDSVDTVNAKMATQRAEFIKVATAAGIPKKAAKDLADSYGLIPNYVDTTVAVKGAKLSQQEADELNEALEGLPDDVKTDIITLANTHGVEVAKEALASVKDKTVTVRINTVGGGMTRHQAVATGGILEYYAAGGFSSAGDYANAHQPTILPAGTNRLFAEPETGGEAYIPLANDWRRGRAENILATVADRFGLALVKDVTAFASGGVAAFATGGVTMPDKALSSVLAGLQIGAFPVAAITAYTAALTKAHKATVQAAAAEKDKANALAKATAATTLASRAVKAADRDLDKAKTGTKAYREAEKDLKKASAAVDPRSQLGKNRTALRDLQRKSTSGMSKSQKKARKTRIDALQKKVDRAEDKRNLRIAEARDKLDWHAEKRDKAIAAAEKKLELAKGAEAKAKEKETKAKDKEAAASQKLTDKKAKEQEAADDLAAAHQRLADTARQASDAFVSKWMGTGTDLAGSIESMTEGITAGSAFADQIEQLREMKLSEDYIQQVIIPQGEIWGGDLAAEIIKGGKPTVAVLNDLAKKLDKVGDRLGMTTAVGVKKYATGGLEDHEAMIGTGVTRVWDEPETGGEAYIPLAESKRRRSLAIWAETGRRLGVAQPVRRFADGAVVPPTATFARTPETQTITYVTHIHQVELPGVKTLHEMDGVAREMAIKIHRSGARRG